MKDLLYFDNMVTPKIITFVYWLLIFMALVTGLGTMFSSFSLMSIFIGLFYIVFGVVAARIWCELLIVLFKMNEALQEIRNK